jgi:hypothetical protein
MLGSILKRTNERAFPQMDNNVLQTMIAAQIAKLEQSIARTVAREIDVLRSLLHCNSDEKFFALEGRNLSALDSPFEVERDANESTNTTDDRSKRNFAKYLRVHEIRIKQGRSPRTLHFRAHLAVAQKPSVPKSIDLEKESGTICSWSKLGKSVSKDPVSRLKATPSFRHRRIKRELEISKSPNVKQDTLPSSPLSSIPHDTPAHTVLPCKKKPPAEPHPLADINQCLAASDPAESKLNSAASVNPSLPRGSSLHAETRDFALAVASTTGSKRALLSSSEGSAIYQPHELTRKVPACFCGGAADAPRRCMPACLDKALRTTLEAVFGISDPNIWVGNPGSSLIHPNSPFSTGRQREQDRRAGAPP